MIAADLHRQIKGDLREAHQTAQLVAPLTDRYDHAIKDAYAIHEIHIDSRIAAINTRAGTAPPVNPARRVAWLANKLGSLSAGPKAGGVLRAKSIHLGAATVRFSTESST